MSTDSRGQTMSETVPESWRPVLDPVLAAPESRRLGGWLRRDRLWNEAAKPDFAAPTLDEVLAGISAMLEDIQANLFSEAKARRDGNISKIESFEALEKFFAEGNRYPGWAEVLWSRPSGSELDQVGERLKALKLTLRNIPMDGAPAGGTCIFTGRPATERIYVARAY